MAKRWQGKHVLIAGGSSGLGLSLVRCLAREGARMTVVGRDKERLRQCTVIASELGSGDVDAICVDACMEESIRASLADFSNGRNKLDLAIHAIGQSDRGHLLQLDTGDLVKMFQTNFVSAFHIAKFCRPALQQSRGSLVLIGSLATRLAPAGLGGYAVTKFPLAAMRQQLAIELAADKIHTMLVCPGPIQRDDAGSRYHDRVVQRGLSKAMAKPGGGAKVKAIDPEWLCQRILRGVERREREIVVPWKAKIAIIASSICPSLGDWILKKSMSQ